MAEEEESMDVDLNAQDADDPLQIASTPLLNMERQSSFPIYVSPNSKPLEGTVYKFTVML